MKRWKTYFCPPLEGEATPKPSARDRQKYHRARMSINLRDDNRREITDRRTASQARQSRMVLVQEGCLSSTEQNRDKCPTLGGCRPQEG